MVTYTEENLYERFIFDIVKYDGKIFVSISPSISKLSSIIQRKLIEWGNVNGIKTFQPTFILADILTDNLR